MTGPAFVPGTKAETLERLRPILRASYVLPLARFTVGEWRAGRDDVLARVAAALGAGRLIVRSSARSEDTSAASNAGAFTSVPGVDGGDRRAVADAVDRVIASYGAAGPDDQVLVQPMLGDVRLAGVVASRDLTTHAPYFVVSYETGGSTDGVTSGRSAEARTYVRFRGAAEPAPSEDLAAVLAAVREIESVAGDRIEVEFAVDGGGRVCVFQCRPLAAGPASVPSEARIADAIAKTAKKVEKLSRPHPHLLGTRSVFGVMPDWNPAEIIGLRPRMLALTLYKEIVTDSVWAYMRDNYGYRNLRSFPLLVSFVGLPYIDVRVSFNSFVPKGVREPLATKLVNYYVDRLVERPEAHDKVEFDIVFSCFYPGVREDLARLDAFGFTGGEIGEVVAQLRILTARIVDPVHGHWRGDLAKIDELVTRRDQVLASPMSAVDRFYWLIEDCKRYGTLPFSGLARAGFIAMQFLRGLVRQGVLSPADQDAFLASLSTVAKRMGAHRRRLADGSMSREEFLGLYGHLRPGTYDVLSPRYDEDFDRYFGGGPGGDAAAEHDAPPFELPAAARRDVGLLLRDEGLGVTADDLFAFMRAGIEGREHAKLVFTRSLSDALSELVRLGEQCGLDRDALSHLDARTVLRLYSMLDAADLRDVLVRDIETNRAAWETTSAVRLPDLILGPEDAVHFHLGRALPNFVTRGRVEAPVVREADLRGADLRGRIVAIRSADPGWDWIFSKGIAGFVTQFGGANSHMAIRAAELRLPAAIGCGERNFDVWSAARRLEIDCAACTVRVTG